MIGFKSMSIPTHVFAERNSENRTKYFLASRTLTTKKCQFDLLGSFPPPRGVKLKNWTCSHVFLVNSFLLMCYNLWVVRVKNIRSPLPPGEEVDWVTKLLGKSLTPQASNGEVRIRKFKTVAEICVEQTHGRTDRQHEQMHYSR
jgi:hypothetical protein